MKEEVYAPDPLNEQASVLVDAQTDIKTAIKQAVLSGLGREAVKAQVKKIIDRAIARIRSPTLKEDGRISLMRFADRTYTKLTDDLSQIKTALLPAVIVLMRAITAKGKIGEFYIPSTPAEYTAATQLGYTAYNKGIPLQEFQKVYINRVSVALDNLAQSYAFDPNDSRTEVEKKNSLRNLAEMQVRYERHQDDIEGFKNRGTRLVVCSVHADCSDRCAKWQGGVYSLDGTEGYTKDGKHYQPLENATDIYYTTKAGRVYKNGLLGFNCRHKLFEYEDGMVIPNVGKEEQKREYAITKTQREMERSVIQAREKALAYKGTGCIVLKRNGKPLLDNVTGKPILQYNYWKKIATKRNEIYKQFSKENGRAYYPDRVKIL